MHRLLFFLFSLLVYLPIYAQDSLKVIKFERYSYVPDENEKKLDFSQKPCGYLKAEYHGKKKLKFGQHAIDQKCDSNGNYWVYISNGGKFVNVRPEGGYAISLPIPPEGIGGNIVYYVVLVDADNFDDKQKDANNFDDKQNKDNWSVGLSEKYIYKGFPINLSIHGAYVTNYVPLELDATLGLKKSSGTYIYDSNGTIKDSYEYTGLRFTARSGYCFEIDKSKRFMITPLGGLSYNVLFGCQIKSASSMQVYADANSSGANIGEAKNWGNGGNAVSFVGGLRFSYAINEHWLIHAMPEYNVNIWKDNNFNFISKTDDGVKAWSDGFNISVGIILRFNNKSKEQLYKEAYERAKRSF